MISGGFDMVVHFKYSFSHCFPSIPNREAAKLRMRLRNQSELIQTDYARGSKGGDG